MIIMKYDATSSPNIKGNPAWPDITKVLLTPDPGMWSDLERHCKEVLSLDLPIFDKERYEKILDFSKKMGKKAAQPLN
jgi:glucuronate isomerase